MAIVGTCPSKARPDFANPRTDFANAAKFGPVDFICHISLIKLIIAGISNPERPKTGFSQTEEQPRVSMRSAFSWQQHTMRGGLFDMSGFEIVMPDVDIPLGTRSQKQRSYKVPPVVH
jgi:hypothetical protein